MKKALTLSIVIPVYNEESYIESCLDAIAAQTILPDQVIVVDNNSTDSTVATARRYPFVTVLHEARQGVLYARLSGMNVASGEIIGRIDGDTRLDPGWVARVKQDFMDSDIHAITGPAGYYDMPLPRLIRWIQDKLLRGAGLMGYSSLFGCNMAIRRSVWREVAPGLCEDKRIFEDLDIAQHLDQRDICVKYDQDLGVMLSARRSESSPRDFWYYIRGHSRTAHHHGKWPIGAYYSEACFMLAYLLTKPLHMSFHPHRRRLSLSWLLGRPTARPNPMDAPSGD